MPSSPNDALYLYGITGAPSVSISASGVAGAVRTMQYADWTAVVDAVPCDEWTGTTGEQNLQALSWVAPRAIAHEQVVEAMMQHGPTYPARFATLFSTHDALKQSIDSSKDKLRSFFETVHGTEEWSVKVHLDRDQALKARAQLSSASRAEKPLSGTAYLQRRQQAQQADTALDAWIDDTLTEIEQALSELARATSVRQSVTPESPAEAPITHWALLVPTTNQASFLKQVEAFDAAYANDGISLTPSGPWPPYTFRPSLNEQSQT